VSIASVADSSQTRVITASLKDTMPRANSWIGLDAALKRLQAARVRIYFPGHIWSNDTPLDTAVAGGWRVVWLLASYINQQSIENKKAKISRADDLLDKDGFATFAGG
jgi:hypothetical protein